MPKQEESTMATLHGPHRQVTVELKNDVCIEGRIDSVDQFLNLRLKDVETAEKDKYPHLVYNIATPCIFLL